MSYLDQLQKLLEIYDVEDIRKIIGVTLRTIQNYLTKENPTVPHPKTQKNINETFVKLITEGRDIAELLSPAEEKQIRKPKTESDPEKEGITFVDRSAQAGYPKKVVDPMFQSSLKKIFIPGMPYRGENFRIWEVEGNSMEPTFKEGYHALTEKIDPQYWTRIKEHHAYVIVTEDDILLKRIVNSKTKENHWALVSDNKELYPPFLLDISLVKELWFVKRRMDWEMSPPIMHDINI
jgi:phage repressor protein C with HTH and peptisase S24 domain